MNIAKKIRAQKNTAATEILVAVLVFSFLVSGSIFLWMFAIHGGNRYADDISNIILVGSLVFDAIIFLFLFSLALSRKKAINQLSEIEHTLTLKHHREITQIEQAKNEFVTLASHQLRTPLSTINWFAEILLHGDAGPLTGPQKKHVTRIMESCTRMIKLVNAILNVSRIELGTFSIQPEHCFVPRVIKEVIAENAGEIEKKKLHVKTSLSPAARTLTVDLKLFSIILQNLISNAVRYTPDKGVITISGKANDTCIILSVADTGFGIPLKSQSKIFSKLFRADNIRHQDTTGSGLGLHIVKAILDNIDGTIHFESKENIGSTFTITIPKKGLRHRTGISVA